MTEWESSSWSLDVHDTRGGVSAEPSLLLVPWQVRRMGVTTPERLLTLTRADLEVLGLDVVEQVTFKRELVVVLRARRRILQRQAASAAGTVRLANPALRRTCDLFRDNM